MIEAGLEAQFQANSRPEGEALRIMKSTGPPLYVEDIEPEQSGPPPRPEIDRTILRKILLDAIPPELVHWSHTLVSAQGSTGGAYTLKFSNGLQTECDLLVGADGAWSKVRALVSEATPAYAGITGAELSLTPETVAQNSHILDLVGQGTLMALDDGKALLPQWNASNRLRTYAWFKGSKDFSLPSDVSEAKAKLLEIYEGWEPWLLELIAKADPEAIYLRPLYTLPTDHKWTNKPGVTLIGDAAHLMSPFAGEGANQAMLDATDLALALVQSKPTEWDQKITQCEEAMFKRATSAAEQSQQNLELAFGDEAAERFTKLFETMMSGVGME